jgi:nicotinamidase-related amidase
MPDLVRQSQTLGQRPALVLVDLINGFTDPACPLGCDSDAVVAVNARLLAAFRQRGLPVFFTTVVYYSDDQASVFRQRLPALNVLEPGSEWVAVDRRLAPLDGEAVIEKQLASGFHGTDLLQRLEAAGADSLVVTGLTTSGCVRATAVDGLQHNYPVFVVSDAVGDRNAEAHAANLHDLHAKYADVVSSDELLSMLDTREGAA